MKDRIIYVYLYYQYVSGHHKDLSEEELYYEIGYRFIATQDGLEKNTQYLLALIVATVVMQFIAFSMPFTLVGTGVLYLYLNSKQFQHRTYIILNSIVLLSGVWETHGDLAQLNMYQWVLLISWNMLFLLNLVVNEEKEHGKKVITPITESAVLQHTNFTTRLQGTQYEVTQMRQNSINTINKDQIIYWSLIIVVILLLSWFFSTVIRTVSTVAGISEEFQQDTLIIVIIVAVILLLPSLLQKKVELPKTEIPKLK